MAYICGNCGRVHGRCPCCGQTISCVKQEQARPEPVKSCDTCAHNYIHVCEHCQNYPYVPRHEQCLTHREPPCEHLSLCRLCRVDGTDWHHNWQPIIKEQA